MKEFSLHLYLVTDEAAKCRHSLLETVQRAVDGGVTIVQYRSTNPDAGTCYREALPIRDFLASRGVPFIVNNRIDLALALDAERARLVRATGAASGIAVVSAICGAEDPEAAARALA